MTSPDEAPDVEAAPSADPAALTPAPTRRRAAMDPELVSWLGKDWDPAPPMPHPAARSDIAPWTVQRRAELSARYPGQLVVVPSGQLKTRANDTDYAFRACSQFVWLTGETAEGAVLVLAPRASGQGHDATLYVRAYHPPGSEGYFTDHLFGALWVGGVPSPSETADALGLPSRPLDELPGALAQWRGPCVALTGVDHLLDPLVPHEGSAGLLATIDELRLVKDAWELGRLRHACEATARGFADVAREIPRVLDQPVRGERWLEGTFWRRARLEGNEVGYTSIIGSGSHATTLHWWRNHGRLHSGDLLLADMGMETDELHTADVTRTFPLDGQWSPAQRKVYSAVLEAQRAGIAEVRVGNDFMAAHHAAMHVLAEHLHSWGVLDVPAAVSCSPDHAEPGAGRHRRWTLHGVSHSLGLDVHDCAQARDELHFSAPLKANQALTVEPGLYFQVNDLSVPAELRGIGIRIEDDVVVGPDGPVVLSHHVPTDPEELVDWLREAQAGPPDLW